MQARETLFQFAMNKGRFMDTAASALFAKLEPIVEARTGRLVACEALMRGFRELGCNSPPKLLDSAHELNALFDIEMLMARKALEALIGSAPVGTRLFLNVDGRTLPQWERYATGVEILLDARDISPAEITLEISEANQVIEGPEFERAIMGLQARGFRVAVDDFGTGVSGLRMLYEAQPQFLKVDRFFIQSMPHDAKRRLLVQAVSRLASTLGSQVIAEGVETREEFLACRWADCELVQGYFIKSPDDPENTLTHNYELPGSDAIETSVDERLEALAQQLPAFGSDVNLRTLFEHYRDGYLGDVVPIVDEADRVQGAILLKDLRPVFGGQYGEALVQNPSYIYPIETLIQTLPTIDLHQDLTGAIDLVADRARDGILLVDRGVLQGYLSPYDLMQLANSIRLSAATLRNPLTGLKGNQEISTYVTKAMAREQTSRLFAYVDISDFKPFNDSFGFEKGDKAILALSTILAHFESIASGFLGHIGGDDFFIATEGEATDALRPLLESLPEKFSAHVTDLLPAEVAAAGTYTGKDREGRIREIPVIGCTISGLHYPAGERSPNPETLAAQLAELKVEAKTQHRNVLIEDAGRPHAGR